MDLVPQVAAGDPASAAELAEQLEVLRRSGRLDVPFAAVAMYCAASHPDLVPDLIPLSLSRTSAVPALAWAFLR